MEVKSAFLNGILNEEAHVKQPKGFIDLHLPEHVFKLKQALYCPKRALWAWYERLTMFLLEKGYKRGETDKTLIIRNLRTNLIMAQIYVDDIVFGSISKINSREFVNLMQSEFENEYGRWIKLFSELIG